MRATYFLGKVSTSGGQLWVFVPKHVTDLLNVGVGDTVHVIVKKVDPTTLKRSTKWVADVTLGRSGNSIGFTVPKDYGKGDFVEVHIMVSGA